MKSSSKIALECDENTLHLRCVAILATKPRWLLPGGGVSADDAVVAAVAKRQVRAVPSWYGLSVFRAELDVGRGSIVCCLAPRTHLYFEFVDLAKLGQRERAPAGPQRRRGACTVGNPENSEKITKTPRRNRLI